MTALAGIWRFGSDDPALACAAMLESQRDFGPHGSLIERLGNVAFGRAASFILPEDHGEPGPLAGPDRDSLFVADVRLDNRDELLRRLGLRDDPGLSDSHLLFRAWLRWGEALLDDLNGDFAFALWDSKDQSLLLVRDTSGQRPLHYHVGNGFIAFASMPCGIHALEEVPIELDDRELARFVADIPRRGSSTYYRHVERVEPGHRLRLWRGRSSSTDYWQLPSHELHYADPDDYVEAFREQLDRATRSRLRRAGGQVAAHLSAGLDSNAVAATAARLMGTADGSLLAMTSAPRVGFAGPVPSGRIADESGLAAATVRLHPNMQHVVIRPSGSSPIDVLRRDSSIFQEPVGLPCNHVWWSAINSEASARGASVMLTGEAGNLTISAGGLAMLAEFVRAFAFAKWLVQARASVRAGIRWRGVLATSFGPFVPAALWRLVSRMADRESPSARGLSLLASDWRSRMERESKALGRGGQPEADNRRLRWSLLRAQDPGNFRKAALGRWSLDERDPTADRRLAEFCFSLPPEQFFADGMRRRLARIALADRLPPEIIDAPRGYQFADWYERIDEAALGREVDELSASPKAASLLDLDRLRQLARGWPPEDIGEESAIATYRLAMLRSIAAGRFTDAKSP